MKHLKNTLLVCLLAFCSIAAQGQTYLNHTVHLPQQLIPTAGQPVNFCAGDSVQIGGPTLALSGTPPYSALWTGPGVGSPTSPNPMVFPVNTSTYYLQVTDAENCTATDSTIAYLVNAISNFQFTQSGPTFTFMNMSSYINTSYWTFGDGDTSTQMNPIHTYSAPGDYVVCLTINVGMTCELTHCDTVTVIGTAVNDPLANANITVFPNPVSGNQLNFKVLGLSLAGEISIDLYDLQGKQMLHYLGDARQAVHTLQRKDLAAGTYLYQVKAAEAAIGNGKIVLR